MADKAQTIAPNNNPKPQRLSASNRAGRNYRKRPGKKINKFNNII